MHSHLSNGKLPAIEQDPDATELSAQGPQADAPKTNLPSRSGFIRSIQAARHAAFDGFQKDPNAQLRLPLHRNLQAHHSQLIALGSAIGTGLFVGVGQGLRVGGPVPLLLAFTFVGFTLCPVVFALGEMATLMPFPGSFIEHSRRFIDDAWGAAIGWNYAFSWLVTLPLELVAASITLEYWGQPLGHRSIWVTIFLVGIGGINLFGVRGWANVEATLSIIKVVAIVGFIIFGVFFDVGLGFGGQAIGTLNWYNLGAVNHGWWGFCSVMASAALAYSGSEMVGLTAAEQVNPRRDMPKAIRKVFWRIGIFYIGAVFIVGLIVRYDDPLLLKIETIEWSSASAFVIAVQRAHMRALPSIINAIILITVLSVANSSVYGSSRVLNALADVGLAPKAFAYIDRVGRPLRCFYLSAAIGILAYLVELKEQVTVFTWLLALCGLSSIISWTSICITHLRFRKALEVQDRPLSSLPFRSPLGTIGTWIGLICTLFIIFIYFLNAVFPVGWENRPPNLRARSFFQSFTAFPLLGVFYFVFKYFAGTHITGVSFTWRRGIRANKPKIVWGDGTHLVDLSQVDFTEAWDLEDYLEDGGVALNELWWCPGPLRESLKRMYFPW